MCVCVYYFFLKKTLNVFQKNDKKTVLIPDFFFSQKISKMETKYKNALKEFSEDFFLIYTVEKKKKLGMDTVEHTASTIVVVQMVTKN